MSRNIISIFFTVLFLAFLTAPAVITLVDDSVDISYFYSITEEEEKGGKIEGLLNRDSINQSDFTLPGKGVNEGYYFKKYTKPHLNLISPPPEIHII
jgi:hypothetical protein